MGRNDDSGTPAAFEEHAAQSGRTWFGSGEGHGARLPSRGTWTAGKRTAPARLVGCPVPESARTAKWASSAVCQVAKVQVHLRGVLHQFKNVLVGEK